MTNRGQTPSDYLIGISLVLVTILGIFAFVPTVFDPFEPTLGPEEQVMADRLADDLVENHTAVPTEQTVNLTALNETLEDDFEATRDASGLPDWKQVNVSVRATTRQVTATGDNFVQGSGSAGTSIRTITSHEDVCNDSCQLVVRVWTR